MQVACAAGYGDPLEREPAAVLPDIANELVSQQQAEQVYGVVVDADRLAVDDDATLQLRDRRGRSEGAIRSGPRSRIRRTGRSTPRSSSGCASAPSSGRP